MDFNVTLIQTGYILGEHNFEEGWHSDDNYHWKECLDDGCDAITQKGAHQWVDDPDKEDIPATAETEGTHYQVCSVCGHKKESVIPVIGGVTERDVDLRALGYKDRNGFTITPDEEKDLVEYSQPASTYNRMEIKDVNTVTFTKAEYAVIKIKNLEDRAIQLFFRSKDSEGTYISSSAVGGSGELVSSANGESSFVRMGSQGAYFNLGAGDTAEFKYTLNNVASITEIGLIPEPNPSEDKAGTFEIYQWYIHDNLI